MGFRLVPKSMTLNDVERRNDRRPARPRYLCGELSFLFKLQKGYWSPNLVNFGPQTANILHAWRRWRVERGAAIRL